MRDWNVVATTRDHEFRRACELLSLGGTVARTEFYNVVVMKVPDVERFLVWLEGQWSKSHHFARAVAHVRPARKTFHFQSPEEFETKAREIFFSWAPRLASLAFHVRLHRRGFKGRLSTTEEEKLLGDVVLDRLAAAGTPGCIRFEDPDALVAIDTVGDRAGLGLWTRDELRRFAFLGVN